MDRKSIEKRIEHLKFLQGEQRELLAQAQTTATVCAQNLQLIRGGLEDCDFWLADVALAEPCRDARAETNGACAAACQEAGPVS